MLPGGSMTTMPPTVVSMVSLGNTTTLRLPLAPGGMQVAVMTVPMARMPTPFNGVRPSQGGGKGIVKSEENDFHCNLGSILIMVTPFLQIPPSF